MAIVASFMIGTIVTGSAVYAAEKPNGQPFDAVWQAIGLLQSQIEQVTVDIDSLEEKIETLDGNNVNCLNEVALFFTTPLYQIPSSCDVNEFLPSIDLPEVIYVQGNYEVSGFEPIYDYCDNTGECYGFSGEFEDGMYLLSCDITSEVMNYVDDPLTNDPLMSITKGILNGFPSYAINYGESTTTGFLNKYQTFFSPAVVSSITFEADDLPSPLPTAEEAIGTLTQPLTVQIKDKFGNTYTDQTTLICSP